MATCLYISVWYILHTYAFCSLQKTKSEEADKSTDKDKIKKEKKDESSDKKEEKKEEEKKVCIITTQFYVTTVVGLVSLPGKVDNSRQLNVTGQCDSSSQLRAWWSLESLCATRRC